MTLALVSFDTQARYLRRYVSHWPGHRRLTHEAEVYNGSSFTDGEIVDSFLRSPPPCFKVDYHEPSEVLSNC